MKKAALRRVTGDDGHDATTPRCDNGHANVGPDHRRRARIFFYPRQHLQKLGRPEARHEFDANRPSQFRMLAMSTLPASLAAALILGLGRLNVRLDVRRGRVSA
jgi:hypothetical protein